MLQQPWGGQAFGLDTLTAMYHGQQTQHILSAANFASCDDGWGPFTVGCRDGRFDFTLFFEQVVFTIVPSACFLLGALVGIVQLWGQKPKVRTTFSYYAKMVSRYSKSLIYLQTSY